MQRPTLQNNLT